MVDLYVKKIDLIIYFPIDKFQFKKDSSHKGSEEFQIEMNKIIKNCIKDFNITNLIELKSVGVEDRAKEIIENIT